MNLKNKVGNIASASLGVALVILFIVIGLFLWWGGITLLMLICNWINPYIAPVNSWVTALSIFLLLPLFLFRKAKTFTYYGFCIAAAIYSFLLFVGSTVIVYSFWGATGVSIGIFLGGITIIPMALIALSLNGEISILGMTLLQCALTIGAFVLSIKCSDRLLED